MDSEFKRFIDTHRALGLPIEIHWAPTKARWQRTLIDNGYNITALACVVILVGNTEYLFSSGPVVWTQDEVGIGPSGLYLLARTNRGEVIPRMYYHHLVGNLREGVHNLEAIKKQYPEYAWEVQLAQELSKV